MKDDRHLDKNWLKNPGRNLFLPGRFKLLLAETCQHCFQRKVSHFRRIFRVTVDNSQQPHWSGKTTDIPVSYGVEILTDNYFVLSQYTHLTHGRTELR